MEASSPTDPPKTRSSAEVKAEIEAERAGLESDIQSLRGETESLVAKIKRKLPFIAAAGVAAGAAYAYLRRRGGGDS
jgi:hypothetical protein